MPPGASPQVLNLPFVVLILAARMSLRMAFYMCLDIGAS